MKIIEMFKLLKVDAEVYRLLANRIYEDLAPTDTTTPYMVWTEVSGTPENHLDGGANVDHLEIQVLIYDSSQPVASKIRTEVCRVLENHGVVDERLGHFETATKLFARGFTVNFWINR